MVILNGATRSAWRFLRLVLLPSASGAAQNLLRLSVSSRRKLKLSLCLAAAFGLAVSANAGNNVVNGAVVVAVAVNGGADSANPGVTCIQIDQTVPAACVGNWIAIKNSNKQLVAAALGLKLTGGRATVHIESADTAQHCPWLAFTPCTLTTLIATN